LGRVKKRKGLSLKKEHKYVPDNFKVELFPEVPTEVWNDFYYEVVKEGLEYISDFRAWRVGSYNNKPNLYKKTFYKVKNNSCCGEFQAWVKNKGDLWIVGCNYGH